MTLVRTVSVPEARHGYPLNLISNIEPCTSDRCTFELRACTSDRLSSAGASMTWIKSPLSKDMHIHMHGGGAGCWCRNSRLSTDHQYHSCHTDAAIPLSYSFLLISTAAFRTQPISKSPLRSPFTSHLASDFWLLPDALHGLPWSLISFD
jgi:hypothetical protein